MTSLELTWTWELQSPLHCGSGLSRPGQADRLVARGPDGRPIVPGDAVKGCLRMAAENVLAWLGNLQSYGPDAPTEPRDRVLAAVFGGRADAHFSPAILQGQEGIDWQVLPFRSTAIEGESGVALRDSLRTIEGLSGPARLAASCRLNVPEEMSGPVGTLLAAALGATESLGGHGGSGWGRVRLVEARLNETMEASSWCGAEQLETLKESFGALPAPAANQPGALQSWTGQGVWYRLVLHLQEETCLGARPDVANHVDTLGLIPATTLRGATKAAWLLSGQPEERVLGWLGTSSRWSPGFPALATSSADPHDPRGMKDPQLLIAMPKSFLQEKEDEAFGTGAPHGVHDGLLGGRPPVADTSPEDGGPETPLQWRRVDKGWMTPDASQRFEPDRLSAMHVAKNYESGSKRSGALFSRSELVSGNLFVSFVRLPEGVEFPGEITVGRRRSAGHGRVTVAFERLGPTLPGFLGQGEQEEGVTAPDPNGVPAGETAATPPPEGSAEKAKRRSVFVQLLSPALVIDPRTGHACRSLSTPADWQDLLDKVAPGKWNQTILAVDGRTRLRRVFGWMSPWGHGTAALPVLEEGSCWRLDCQDEQSASLLREALGNLAESGLGGRLHEGYGWFVVDPPWLGCHRGREAPGRSPVRARPSPDGLRGPAAWPGCELLEESDLEAIQKNLPPNLTRSLRGPLQELSRRAREPQASPAKVRRFLLDTTREELGQASDVDGRKSKGKGPWTLLLPGQGVRDFLDPYLSGSGDQALQRLRFALQALLINLPGSSE